MKINEGESYTVVAGTTMHNFLGEGQRTASQRPLNPSQQCLGFPSDICPLYRRLKPQLYSHQSSYMYLCSYCCTKVQERMVRSYEAERTWRRKRICLTQEAEFWKTRGPNELLMETHDINFNTFCAGKSRRRSASKKALKLYINS